MRSHSIPVLVLVLAFAAAQAAAELLDPLDFASLGTLSLANGSFTIDTDALTITDDANPGVPLATGVLDDQQGQADSYGPGGDVTTVGPAGVPHIAVFIFDDLTLASTASLTLVGHRALALLSHGNALVDTALVLRGEPGTQVVISASQDYILPALRGGPGGFAGGSPLGLATPEAGFGPAGGGPTLSTWPLLSSGLTLIWGGGGGHGSAGDAGKCEGVFLPCATVGGGGPATAGPLDAVLRGGSGGGGVAVTPQGVARWQVGGNGGSGALEIGALGTVTLGQASDLDVSSRLNERNQIHVSATGSWNFGQASGAAGALRLHAARLINLGSANLLAAGAVIRGSGTILLRGVDTTFVVGQSSINPAQLGVGPNFNGVLSVGVARVTVLEGESFELSSGNVVHGGSPRIEVAFEDIEIRDAATGTVPAGGFANAHEVRLGGPVARITGSGPFSNDGVVRGTGSIEVPFTNGATGSVDVSHEELAFTEGLLNLSGGSINVLTGRLTVPGDGVANDDGLVNLGNLNLIDAVVDGDVRSPGDSAVQVAGVAAFNGLFSGAAGFSGTQNLVVFNGGYDPGDSAAQIGFGGDLAFGPLGALTLELGGLLAGVEHDRLDVAGELALAGGVALAPLGGFAPPLGASFTLLTHGTRTGEFSSVAGVQQPGELDLALRYAGGAVVADVVRRGDVNGDGALTEADTAIVESAAASGLVTTAYAAGDVDGSGSVDASDVSIVEHAVEGGGAPAVPALADWMKGLLAVALCAALLTRLRQRVSVV